MTEELVVRDLVKRYGEVLANDHVSFNVNEGEIVCVLGANGAGKTTLIKTICGLVIPDEGECQYRGRSLGDNAWTRASVGAVLEGSRNIYQYLSVVANLRYFGRLNRVEKGELGRRIDANLERFDLSEKRDVLVRELSRGMQQKVAILVALIKDPPILVLDEPTLGLDIPTSSRIVESIKALANEEGKIILITTHDVSVIEGLRRRVLFLKSGDLILDSTLNDIQLGGRDSLFETEFAGSTRAIVGGPVLSVRETGTTATVEHTGDLTLAELRGFGEIIATRPRASSFEEVYRTVLSRGEA
ncbi:MAG: ABC transporter ATP-binding protein [Actinomycetales bacterium]|nr:ABC transporter ATP-binding protein [Candidatus Lutibacillus vidarii]